MWTLNRATGVSCAGPDRAPGMVIGSFAHCEFSVSALRGPLLAWGPKNLPVDKQQTPRPGSSAALTTGCPSWICMWLVVGSSSRERVFVPVYSKCTFHTAPKQVKKGQWGVDDISVFMSPVRLVLRPLHQYSIWVNTGAAAYRLALKQRWHALALTTPYQDNNMCHTHSVLSGLGNASFNF